MRTLNHNVAGTGHSGVGRFIDELRKNPAGPLFNPWYDRDPENDATPHAPEIRREQLRTYLEERLGKAKLLLVAEAVGYQGGHFTGIAMTSERILLGHQQEKYGIRPDHVFRGRKPVRTSRSEVNRNGMSEPTATIVWGALVDLGINPYEVVLWNAVPWHPWNGNRGRLSNRTPTERERKKGLKLLNSFLSLYPEARPVAVGRKCEESLSELGIGHQAVRHPANGGAPRFRAQLRELIRPLA